MKTHNKNTREEYLLSENDFGNTDKFINLLNEISDIPASMALHNISISSAGITNQNAVVYIRSLDDKEKYSPLFCTIDLGVDLKINRGIHMSRLIQAVFELAEKKYDKLDDFAIKLAEVAKDKQGSLLGVANVNGTYIHTNKTKKSDLDSMDTLYILSKAIVQNDSIKVNTGLKIYNITACPCTKAQTKYVIAPELKKIGLSVDQINSVLNVVLSGTHTQRGTTLLSVDKEKSDITHKDLYQILDASTHLVYDLLKRPDEHELVMRALRNPQFTEDVVREVAITAYEKLQSQLSLDANLYVESILNDSIHIHDVKTVINKTFREIKTELEQ